MIESKRQHVRTFFSKLEFNPEQHAYNYGNRTLSSVSSVIKRYVEHVDFDRIAYFVAKKRSREEGRIITKAMVLQEWEDKKNNSCNQGNKAHSFGEIYKKGDAPTDGFEKAIVNFWDSVPSHIQPFMFELKMFSTELGIAGTSDIILYNTKTGKFIIADYKTNEDLFKNHKGKKLLKPFGTLLDNPFNKYQIQLSLYQYLFEQCGFEVESRRVIWLKADGSFQMYKTKDYRKRLIKELKR